MNTRNISWGVKAAGEYGWQPYHLHVPIVWKSGSPTSLNPQGLSRPIMGLLYPFTLILRETRLDGWLRILSYTFTKYNSFSAETNSAVNTQVWEECFIYNYSALCGMWHPSLSNNTQPALPLHRTFSSFLPSTV